MSSPVTTTIQAAPLGVTTTTSQAPGVMMAPVIQTASNIASCAASSNSLINFSSSSYYDL
jgi:hypothetical protein